MQIMATRKKIWQNLKTLKGSSTPNKTHLLHNNKKIHDDADKEPIFREIWSNTFQITQQKNQLFDQTTDTLVNNFINTHRTDIEPYTTTNLNNLSPDNPLTRKITHCEVTTIIKHMKNNTPGHTNINKKVLQHLPPEAIDKFVKLFNLALSIGIFRANI